MSEQHYTEYGIVLLQTFGLFSMYLVYNCYLPLALHLAQDGLHRFLKNC
jgi:hypothetical protein